LPRSVKQQNGTQPTTAQKLGGLIKSARDTMRKDKGLNGDLDRLPMLTWVMFLKFLDDLERVREEEAIMGGKSFRPIIDSPYRWRDWAARHDGITGDELIAFINNDETIRPDGTKGPGLFAYLRSLQSTGSGNGDTRRDVIANNPNRNTDLQRHSPEELIESILKKERRIAEIMEEIQAMVGNRNE
jgi:type I restriction enzyme M protein